jgi:MFS family permease
MTLTAAPRTTASSPQRSMVLPLALAQFIASYAASNMNVAISAIAGDLNTTVIGLQTAITLFTLTMASLMIPGSKLSDIRGRKNCFIVGLIIYGVGALLAACAPGLGVMIVGYSILEGVGSALMIPPIYILVTVWFPDVKTRAKYFGLVSGAGGLGAAAGPLIGGLITSWISWRASFVLQVVVVAWIVLMARKIFDPPRTGPRPHFDGVGAVLAAAGLFFVVFGILLSRTYGWGACRQDFKVGDIVLISQGGITPVWIAVAIGGLLLWGFYLHIRATERHGREPLVHSRLFKNKTSNLGLGTQTIQWLVLQGISFVVSVYLQEVRHFSAIETGLTLTPATIGLLAASAGAERFARRHPQRWLVISGFMVTTVGILLLLLLRKDNNVLLSAPGLLLVGIGVGVMLTSSVNIVQSSFPDNDQADISGVSRSASNLGSSLGTALCGSVLVSTLVVGNHTYALAIVTMAVFSFIGLVIAYFIPKSDSQT